MLQPSKIFYIYNRTAFRWRSHFLSGILFANLGGVLQTEYVDGGISLDAFFSLLSDKRLGQPEFQTNAGSYKFYSVNPSIVSVTPWMEFKFKPLFTKIYFNLDVSGRNYAKGFSLGLVTTLKWNTRSSMLKQRRRDMFFEDFEERDFGNSYHKEDKLKSSEPLKDSHFEEEEDPYSEDPIQNNELSKELQLLKE